jgi:hypothetical protein
MNKKELQIVSCGQAERLKKLGFDWECRYCYSKHSDGDVCLETEEDEYEFNYNYSDGWGGNEAFSAPPLALALKWMRDEKGFDYSIIKERLPFTYTYTLLNGTRARLHIKGYEVAESALLDEILTILEKEEQQ